MAHELAHIKNRDTLTMIVTATIAGAVSMLANFAMFFGGSSSQDGARRGLNPIVGILVMILAPLAASLVQMAISRTREYSADRDGAKICGEPMALASALSKLEQSATHIPNEVAEDNPATAHMFIINPLHGRSMDNLFATHPSTANRIKALQELESGGMHEQSFDSQNFNAQNLGSLETTDYQTGFPLVLRRGAHGWVSRKKGWAYGGGIEPMQPKEILSHVPVRIRGPLRTCS